MAHLDKNIYQVEPSKEWLKENWETKDEVPFPGFKRCHSWKKANKIAKKYGKGSFIYIGRYNMKRKRNGRKDWIKWNSKRSFVVL